MAAFQDYRYRVAISLGRRLAPEVEVAVADFLQIFGSTFDVLRGLAPDVALTQKGLVYTDSGAIKNLRARAFSSSNLVEYMRSSVAVQEGVYVYDSLSASRGPRLLGNAHWFLRGRIGNIPLSGFESMMGHFVMLAVDQELLASGGDTRFDEAALLLHHRIGGVAGGLLLDREYVWNGRAGLEWAYREIPQSVPAGDLAAWTPPFDRIF